jgi:sugar lactone lactonase YvrE
LDDCISDPGPIATALLFDDLLGEGPVWLPDEQRLLHVDIDAGIVHAWDWADGSRGRIELDAPLSFAIPRRGGGLVVGQRRTVVLLDGDGPGGPRTLVEVEHGREGNRFNDAKCDPAGRLWAGTMSTVREPGVAGLYRVEHDGATERMVEGTTLSNGLGWSGDGERMYFIDSTTQRIDVFDFDVARGRVSGRRTFAEIDPADGLPDGLTVDAEDGVWVALYGGGAVRRYGADGRLDAVLEVPVSNPTCPVFGGPELDVLFVTTARHRLTAEQAAAQPLAGAVLALRPGVRGRPAHPFAG